MFYVTGLSSIFVTISLQYTLMKGDSATEILTAI